MSETNWNNTVIKKMDMLRFLDFSLRQLFALFFSPSVRPPVVFEYCAVHLLSLPSRSYAPLYQLSAVECSTCCFSVSSSRVCSFVANTKLVGAPLFLVMCAMDLVGALFVFVVLCSSFSISSSGSICKLPSS